MLGTVDLSGFEEEEQESLYRRYKSLLAPGDFFPGDAFMKGSGSTSGSSTVNPDPITAGLDGVTNDPIWTTPAGAVQS